MVVYPENENAKAYECFNTFLLRVTFSFQYTFKNWGLVAFDILVFKLKYL